MKITNFCVLIFSRRLTNKYSDYSLPREEALSFLENKLCLMNAEELFEQNKTKLLNQIIGSWFQKIPFHNWLRLTREEPKEAPNAQQATKNILIGIGGLCGTHGIGAYHILSAIGYDCYPIMGQVDRNGLNHTMVIVRDLYNPGDLSLVDVGCGYPTFEAIPLQVSGSLIDSTEVICESFLKYKYVRDGNTFSRYHFTSAGSGFEMKKRQYVKYIDDVWGEDYIFDLNPVSCNEVREQLNRNVSLKQKHELHRSFLACKYPNCRYTGILGSKIVQEVKEKERRRLKFSSYEGIDELELFRSQNFPEIPKNVMMDALNVWQKLSEDIRL